MSVKNVVLLLKGLYLLFLLLGMGLACVRGAALPHSLVDYLAIIDLSFAWFAAWMFAVHVNDMADQPIDAITNQKRPLVRGVLSADEMRQGAQVWLAYALAGAWSTGVYSLALCVVYLACYYIYSAPPLRMKRVPVLASALIAGAALCTFLAGYMLLSADKDLEQFPRALALFIMLVFTLGVNMRDIKDIAGDRAQGIMTLPILFGRYGTQVTGALFSLSFLIVPVFFHLPRLMFAALPAAGAAYVIAVRKPYQEKGVFILYFLFIAVMIGFLALSPECRLASAPFCEGG